MLLIIIMSVVCQALNVIVKVDVLNNKYPGGIGGYKENVPNNTFCSDGKLTRVGFMSPQDVGKWVEYLENYGLVFSPEDEAIDICIVDEFEGPTTNCIWIDQYRNDNYSYVCLANDNDYNVVFPDGFDQTPMKFIKTEEIDNIEMTGIDGSIESYLIDGKEMFIGRTSDDTIEEEKNKTVKILKSNLKNNK